MRIPKWAEFSGNIRRDYFYNNKSKLEKKKKFWAKWKWDCKTCLFYKLWAEAGWNNCLIWKGVRHGNFYLSLFFLSFLFFFSKRAGVRSSFRCQQKRRKSVTVLFHAMETSPTMVSRPKRNEYNFGRFYYTCKGRISPRP